MKRIVWIAIMTFSLLFWGSVFTSCSSYRGKGMATSNQYQRDIVSLNKKQSKGLKKASKTVNARLSKEAYGNR